MSSIKAVFFDRDGTLTFITPQKQAWLKETVELWSGRPFSLPYDKMMRLFTLASEGKTPWYRTVSDEMSFIHRYYYHLLQGEGVTRGLNTRAEALFTELWCNDKALFPDTENTLLALYMNGFRMGVISDTSPSLELSLKKLGIARYFESFTASSLVGAGKPDPRIYQAALDSLGVKAEESVYIDDCLPEAEGAAKMGFTAYHLDREASEPRPGVLHSLTDLLPLLHL